MKLIRITKQDYTLNGETRRVDIISIGEKLTIFIYRKMRSATKRIRVYKGNFAGTYVYVRLPF